MLPPGTQFDLFRGTAPVTIEDETYPTRLERTIRVCSCWLYARDAALCAVVVFFVFVCANMCSRVCMRVFACVCVCSV